ncbi:MAG: lysozyme, partial [Candidatus Planktophila sp.]
MMRRSRSGLQLFHFISEAAHLQSKSLEMLKHHEGVRLKPYRCPARLWTIGVGHVIDPSHIRVKFEERLSLPIPNGWDRTLTMAEVDEILAADLQKFEAGVRRLCPFALTPNRLDALT